MDQTYTVFRKVFDPYDPRLGRHVNHDSRSLSYQIEAKDVSTLKSIKHEHHIPTLDQGQVGSCTGNATVGCLGTTLFWDTAQVKGVLSETDAAADEQYALKAYSLATQLDPYKGTYPPNDTGSDGLSVAKAAQKLGLISGYQHATSLEAVLTALSKQAVIVGTSWRNDMFTPDQDGRLRITGKVVGAHEYVLDELDVERQLVWMKNSWSDGWGLKGRAYLLWTDLQTLLADYGDCTVFVPITQPAPTPTPPAPKPDLKDEVGKLVKTFEDAAKGFFTALDSYFSS